MNIADSRVRDLAILAALPAMFLGVGACWLLAGGSGGGPEVTALPSAMSVGPAVLLVGLGVLPTVDAHPSSRVVGVVAGVWVVGALISAWVRAAGQAGVDVSEVGVGQFSAVMSHGAPELVAAACALLVLAWAVVDVVAAQTIPVLVVAVLAGIGVIAVSIAGHPAQNPLAPLLVAVHALAAAWWCGTLAALVVSVRGRSGWARSLPSFADRAVWVVVALAATGTLAAVIELDSVSQLVTTGYGRIIVAKVAGLGILVAAAARYRRAWLPGVARHRVPENVSIRRAAVHILVMAVVLGLAVGLASTAP